jgi:hypothetical protein
MNAVGRYPGRRDDLAGLYFDSVAAVPLAELCSEQRPQFIGSGENWFSEATECNITPAALQHVVLHNAARDFAEWR